MLPFFGRLLIPICGRIGKDPLLQVDELAELSHCTVNNVTPTVGLSWGSIMHIAKLSHKVFKVMLK